MQPDTVDTRPHLLFVGAFPPPESQVSGGVLTSCRTLMASSFPTRVRVTTLDSTQVSVPPPPLYVRAFHALSRMLEFARKISRERPDAALLLCGNGLSFLEKAVLARYARARGVPSILAPRGGDIMRQLTDSALRRLVGRVLLNGPNMIMCQGEHWRGFIVRQMQVPSQQFAVVSNWTASRDLTDIGASRVAARSAPTDFAPADREATTHLVTLLFMGWIEESKGIFELLEAMEALAMVASLPPYRLCIAGEGSASQDARVFVASRGLHNVQFLGWVRDKAKLDLLRDADVLVLPSWHEGLPNVMVEAMACALPVIVTPVGSIPEFVRDGVDAILVPVRDVDALARALCTLLLDGDMRDRIGNAAQQSATEQFSVERAADRLVKLVDRVSRRRSG